MTGPYTQQRHCHVCRCPFYVLSLSLEPAATQVAWSCATHGGRPQSQERPLRSAGTHMQVQHEDLQDRHRHMGGCRR